MRFPPGRRPLGKARSGATLCRPCEAFDPGGTGLCSRLNVGHGAACGRSRAGRDTCGRAGGVRLAARRLRETPTRVSAKRVAASRAGPDGQHPPVAALLSAFEVRICSGGGGAGAVALLAARMRRRLRLDRHDLLERNFTLSLHDTTPRVRTFQLTDRAAARALLRRSLALAGVPTVDRPGPGVAAPHEVEHRWVAECDDGEVVGVATLVHEQDMVARLSELRVAPDPDWEQSDAAGQLIRAVVRRCHHFGYLKLVVETPLLPERALRLFGRCGLRYTRQRGGGLRERRRLEFYVDLYHHQEERDDVKPVSAHAIAG